MLRPSDMTANLSPVATFRSFLIALGMTTCPFDDKLVISTALMARSLSKTFLPKVYFPIIAQSTLLPQPRAGLAKAGTGLTIDH